MELNQQKGKKHINYIQELANEIWCKENESACGRRSNWNECLRRALRLHINGLIRNKNDQANTNPRRTWW